VKGGIRVAPDQRPFYRFFERSDNIEFAWEGIPAHTLSSYNLHQDYHARTDEAQGIDFSHLASVIDAAARAVRLVANGSAPKWNPGGRPEKE
jgi:Iap family predicted aminopeptidase